MISVQYISCTVQYSVSMRGKVPLFVLYNFYLLREFLASKHGTQVS